MPRGKSASGGNLFYRRKQSWRADEFVSRSTLQLLDFDDGSPPEYAWRRKLSSHANRLKEFNVTFREAFKMMKLGLRLWSYVREEASYGRELGLLQVPGLGTWCIKSMRLCISYHQLFRENLVPFECALSIGSF